MALLGFETTIQMFVQVKKNSMRMATVFRLNNANIYLKLRNNCYDRTFLAQKIEKSKETVYTADF
jgi:hypothetical protein